MSTAFYPKVSDVRKRYLNRLSEITDNIILTLPGVDKISLVTCEEMPYLHNLVHKTCFDFGETPQFIKCTTQNQYPWKSFNCSSYQLRHDVNDPQRDILPPSPEQTIYSISS